MLIADVIVRATEQLQVAVGALEKNKDGTVLNACVQVKRLEEEGDSLYHEWLGRLFEGRAGRAHGDQVEGDLRQPREDAGLHRGRGERARIDLHQARVIMSHDVVYVLAIVADRAGLRLHQRLPRQRQLDRDGGLDPGALAGRGGGLGGGVQLRSRRSWWGPRWRRRSARG